MISRRRLLGSALAAPAILKVSSLLAATVTPTGWPNASATDARSLPQVLDGTGLTQLPNPFVMNDGTPITTKLQWYQHRAELKQIYQIYAIGHIPPPLPVTLASTNVSETLTTANGTMGHRNYTISIVTPLRSPMTFTVNVYIPISPTQYGSGPYPMILYRDLKAGQTTGIGRPPCVQNNDSIGLAGVNMLTNLGYVIAEGNHDEASGEWEVDGFDSIFGINGDPDSLGDPVYVKFPFDRNSGTTISPSISGLTAGLNASPAGYGGIIGYDSGCHAAWCWHSARILDFLLTQSYVNPTRCCLGGISHTGNMALNAAIMDERWAAVMCDQSQGWSVARNQDLVGTLAWGVGGNFPIQSGALNGEWAPRVPAFGASGGTSVVTRGGAGLNTSSVAANMARLPWEMHLLMGMMAPRPFYSLETFTWGDRIPQGIAQNFLAGQEIYRALGLPLTNNWIRYKDSIYCSGSGGHELANYLANGTTWNSNGDYTSHIAFLEHYWNGTALPANVTTSGSQSLWCNTSADFNTALSKTIPPAFNWSTPILT